jgi:hypothetical protein
VCAPASLFALPLGGLLLAAGPRTRADWLAAGGVVALGVATILRPETGLLHAATGACAVLVAAAFVLRMVLRPGRFLPRAAGAACLGAAAGAVVAAVAWGPGFIEALRWQAAREAGAVGRMVAVPPELTGTIDRVVGFAAVTLPAAVALLTLAGLALAWSVHHRLAARPLGPPLGRFRDFRFADAWVWTLVAAGSVYLVPRLTAWQDAALNVGLVAAALYVLRGAAIVTAFAQSAGVSLGALTVGTVVAASFMLPMFLIVPGLWTLGVTDTWVEFRRRLAAGSNVQ